MIKLIERGTQHQRESESITPRYVSKGAAAPLEYRRMRELSLSIPSKTSCQVNALFAVWLCTVTVVFVRMFAMKKTVVAVVAVKVAAILHPRRAL
ncbi:hypothetical protein BD309DRAFT_630457 [Dichomitus squalens]|nr:hypothetical protein BD309DRAFT_630457 [Dichomitus squalens]